jgi:hypothetical protein
MVGKSVSEKLKEKAAKAPEQSIMNDEGFKVLGGRGEGSGDVTFLSFAKQVDGFKIIGKFLGTTTGKYGENIRLETENGEVQFVKGTGLKDMDGVEVGSIVRITMVGLVPTKSGREFRKFEIAVKKA